MRTHTTYKPKPYRQYKNLLPNRAMVATEANVALARTMMNLECYEEHYVYALTHLQDEPSVRAKFLDYLADAMDKAHDELCDAVNFDMISRCDD